MENTAKNFALQLGSLVSLYISVTALITLLFGIITVQYPDAAQGYWEYENASSSIRMGVALLFVFFPAYLILTRIVNKVRRSEQGTYLKLTKWMIYLSLLLGGVIILVDLVMVINTFLNGEITIRFLLKSLAFLIIVGSAFVYYLYDAKGLWQRNEKASILYGATMFVIVLASVVLGVLNVEKPSDVREKKLDSIQVNDLANIQSRIDSYMYQEGVLPESIEIAFDNMTIPAAPDERAAYTYTIKDTEKYQLCATFAYESINDPRFPREVMYTEPNIGKQIFITWDHKAGEWCFDRSAPKPEKQLK